MNKNAELLQYAAENGIIDLAKIQAEIAMRNREEILKNHKSKITQGADQYWRTRLPDSKKTMIKKKSKEDLEDALVSYYKKQEKIIKENAEKTFDEVYWNWRNVQDEFIGGNSANKYDSDYKRYFENTDFAKTKVANINIETVKLFIVRSVKEKKLCKEACKSLCQYTKNTLESAKINNIILENPMKDLTPKFFYKYCVDPKKKDKDKIISKEEMQLIYEQLELDHKNKPEYIPSYAVEFAAMSGMRVSEIAALKWECITDDIILIDKSEKYNRKTKTYYIGATKNGNERVFPVTEDIKKLLERVKKVEMEHGYICEWVFANEKGRIHAPVISSCIKNKCRQLGIKEKGIHALRKTLNSNMRCAGVSTKVASTLLGHSEAVNQKYYTFDVTDIAEKAKIIANANLLKNIS